MATRKALFITYHFPPSAASGTFRILGFTRHLSEFGWQPMVVAPPSTPWEPVDPQLLAQVPPDTPCLRVPYPEGRLARLAMGVAGHRIWLPKAFFRCLEVVRAHRPDTIVTSGPPHCVHLLGLAIKRRYGLPWLADFRDPMVRHDSHHRKRTMGSRFEALAEKSIFRHADRIIANAPLASGEIQQAYPEYRHKILTITNGFDPESFPNRASPRSSKQAIRIVHTGEFYAGRDPRPFLDVLAELRSAGTHLEFPFQVVLLGRHDDLPFDLRAAIGERSLREVVELAGQVSYDEAIRQMIDADILLLLDAPGRRMGVPAKLYEYLGARRPVLALAESDGDTAWVLRTSGAVHRLCPPAEKIAIRQSLTELLRGSTTDAAPMSQSAQLMRFSRRCLTEQLAEAMNTCQPRWSRNGQIAILRHSDVSERKQNCQST
jgi:glycosyltransferase involved in cell wall biosynthesis